jgi:hypothetical protein
MENVGNWARISAIMKLRDANGPTVPALVGLLMLAAGSIGIITASTLCRCPEAKPYSGIVIPSSAFGTCDVRVFRPGHPFPHPSTLQRAWDLANVLRQHVDEATVITINIEPCLYL